ncbi:hypothetical protein S40293_11290 [Stachybotrys chartarum IBT 40293]|nr:hypothetical protein S40293_11290 [Stachybotrys chartarum IBT 40293]
MILSSERKEAHWGRAGARLDHRLAGQDQQSSGGQGLQLDRSRREQQSMGSARAAAVAVGFHGVTRNRAPARGADQPIEMVKQQQQEEEEEKKKGRANQRELAHSTRSFARTPVGYNLPWWEKDDMGHHV